MNICTNSHTRSGAARVFSWVLAFVMVFSLVAVPAATASADTDTYSAELVFSMEGMDFSGKIALDLNQVLLGVIAGMSSEGQTLMDAAAYIGAQALAVDSDLIGGAYGIDLTTIAQNLPKSIFAPNSGSSYALEQEVYDQIMSLLNGETVQSAPVPDVNTDAMTSDLTQLLEVYSGVAEEILSYPVMGASSASVVINGTPIQVDQVECTMDADACISVVNALIAPLQNNPQAQTALADLIDQAAAASQRQLGASGAEIVEAILTELPQELEDARDELTQQGFSVSAIIGVASESQMPVKLALEFSSNSETNAINLLMSEGLDFFRMEATENGSVTGAFEFAVKENSDSALICSFAVQADGEEAGMTFELNKQGKAFLLTITAQGESHSVSGFYSVSDSLFSATVDQIDGESFGGTITLNLRSQDTIALPSFTEVTTLSESAFTELVQTISQNAESLSQMFG